MRKIWAGNEGLQPEGGGESSNTIWTIIGLAALAFAAMVRLVARGWFSDTTAYCVARVYAVLTRLLNWGR